MTDETTDIPGPAFAVGDVVRPIGAPDVHPKPIERVVTTYEDDFDTPLPRVVYIVRGFRFLEHELLLVRAANTTAQEGEA